MAEKDVLETVAGFIKEVINEEWIEDTPITMETSFSADLELESIEFVALAEKMQDHYGDEVDFVEWMSTMELDQIIALRVGQVVEFIESRRR